MTTQQQSTPPPGWYHDPQTPSMTRYFDGTTWTEHVAPAGTPAFADPPVPYAVAKISSATVRAGG